MRRLIRGSAWVLLSVLTGVTAAAAQDDQSRAKVGEVSVMRGTASAEHEGSARVLSPSAPLYFLDMLQTGDDARLVAELLDETEITLGGNASLLVDEFIYDPETSSRVMALRSIAGAFVVAVGQLKDLIENRISVRTPAGLIELSEGQVWGGEIDGGYGVLALEGGATVNLPSGLVGLQEGEGVTITDPATPVAAVAWPADKVRRAFATVAMNDEDAATESRHPLVAALLGGRPSADLRYRFEFVDDDAFSRAAMANTVRARLGYETGSFAGIRALVEAEAIEKLGARRFNDGVHGDRRYPVVADPDHIGLNRYWIAYQTPEREASVKLGRQRIAFDNQRFVGGVGFRQNDQTFEAIRLGARPLPSITLDYAYVYLVDRITGEDAPDGDYDSDSHLMRASWRALDNLTLVGYGHLLDFEEAPAASVRTVGLRLLGTRPLTARTDLLLAVEGAWQRPYASNPADADLFYFLVEPGVSHGPVRLRLGYEVLTGDGATAFQTPIGTNHAFQGAADTLLVTPGDGIRDLYAAGDLVVIETGWLSGTRFELALHRFWSSRAGRHYGDEIDVAVSRKLFQRFSVGLAGAYYRADDRGTDVAKVWLTLGFRA